MRVLTTTQRLCLRQIVTGLLLCAATLSSWAAVQRLQILNAAGQPLSNAAVAVFVKGVSATTTGKTVDMGQRNKKFVPPLIVIQTGTAVNFPNFDTVRHHVYSFSPIKPFEIKLYSGRPAAPVVFDKPGTATLGCNIHDSMVGYIHVVDTPYFGITNEQGILELDLPSGDHRVRIWHPSMTETNPGQEFRATVGNGPVTLQLRN